MTDRERDGHEFSEGQGFSDPYDPFDLDPPELSVDTDKVDPVDSRVLADMLDERSLPTERVSAEELLDVGVSYVHINRHEQATETFERAARFAEDPAIEQEAWTNKGAAHAELEEWDAAIGAYREAIAIDDESDLPRTTDDSHAESEADVADVETRTEASGTGASSEHTATAETNLAYALWESGRTEQALEHAERAVEIDPRFAEAWYNRGFFLLERGLAEDAVNAFDNALRLGFRNAEILEEKARALEETGQYDRAEELAEEAEELRKRAEQELME